MELRPYQSRDLDSIRAAFRDGRKAPLFVAPTGYGKTVLFSVVTQGAQARGNRVMILAHRGELIDQISAALSSVGVAHGFIAAGYPVAPGRLVQVASVQTLIRRVHSVDPPRLVILDEAHHSTLKNTIGKILAAWPDALRLGVTATPTRLSGEGLGDVFDTMILGPTAAQLTDMGYLSRARVFAPSAPNLDGVHVRQGDYVQSEAAAVMDVPSITGDAVTHYQKLAPGLPFVVFCLSINHARNVAAQFRGAGINCVEVHGQMDAHTRRSIIADFRSHNIRGLASVNLISEGFDVPGIHCGISLRPTASLGLWIQQVGRCLRIADGKREAIILDHAGNALRHGLPTDTQEWTLEGRTKAARKAAQVSLRVCPQCFAAMSARLMSCRECGHTFETKDRKVLEVEGELQEITERKQARKEQGSARTLEQLVEIGKRRGYVNPYYWAKRVMEGRKRA